METITEQVAGLVFTAELPVQMSGKGPVFHAGDLRRFELSIARRLAELGVATGDAFQFMRKSLGFTVAQVATLFDVAPDAVRAWESRNAAAPRAAFVLLGTMADDELRGIDTTRRYLEAMAHPASHTSGAIALVLEE
jgi:DNA-binding transcriptional regulator YiaG